MAKLPAKIKNNVRQCDWLGMEKWGDKKNGGYGRVGDKNDLVVPYVCLVERMEKWSYQKLFFS